MMSYSKKQEIISVINRGLGYDRFIVNKRGKGQRRKFKCACCGVIYDFTDSVDYVGAVDQWESGGNRCYACENGYCHCSGGSKWG